MEGLSIGKGAAFGGRSAQVLARSYDVRRQALASPGRRIKSFTAVHRSVGWLVETDVEDKAQVEALTAPPQRSGGPSKLVACRFEVRIDGNPHDQFYDVRDATASARIAKRLNPASVVVVTDVRTGKLVIHVEG